MVGPVGVAKEDELVMIDEDAVRRSVSVLGKSSVRETDFVVVVS